MQQVSPQPRCFNFVLKNILVRTLSQRVPLIETIGNQGSWLIQQQVWRAGVFLPLCCSYSAKQTVHLQSKGDSNCKLIPDVREPRISPVCFLEACRHFQKKKKQSYLSTSMIQKQNISMLQIIRIPSYGVEYFISSVCIPRKLERKYKSL